MATFSASSAANNRKLYFVSLDPSTFNSYVYLPSVNTNNTSIYFEMGTPDEGETYDYFGAFQSTSTEYEFTDLSGTVTGARYKWYSHDYSGMPEVYSEGGFSLNGFSLDVSYFQGGFSAGEIAELIFSGNDVLNGSS